MLRPGSAAGQTLLILVYIALLLLLMLTWGLSFVELGSWNLPVALAIAVAKALLVVSIFMELRTSPAVNQLFAAAGLAWLAILFLLSFSDYAWRLR